MKTKTAADTAAPFKDLADIGEIIPDSSGKTKIRVRLVERRSDGVRLLDVRKFVENPDKDKYSGPTPAGLAFSDSDSIQELIDLLEEGKAEFEKLGKSKKVKKADKKKA